MSVVDNGIEADSKLRNAVWRRCGRSVRLVFTPVEASSSGKLCTCSVIWTRVRGMRRVRMMLRSVLWRRVSRWRSRGAASRR